MPHPEEAHRRRERDDAAVDRELDDLLEGEVLPDVDDDIDGPEIDAGSDADLEADLDSPADDSPSGRPARRRDASVAADLPIGELPFVDDDRGLSQGDSRGFAVDEDWGSDVDHFEASDLGGSEGHFVIDDGALEEGPRSSHDDGGVEGTSEDIAGEVDEANLPDLDADEDGSFDLDDLMRELRADGLGHESSAASWISHEALAVPVACCCVAVEAGRVIAGGRVLAMLEPGSDAPRRHSIPRDATAVICAPSGAIVGSLSGIDWVAPNTTIALLESERPVSSLGTFGGRTWALVGEELWQLASPPAAATLVRKGVVAMAALPEAMVVVTVDGRLERFRGDDGAWAETALTDEPKSIMTRATPRIALGARGRALAIFGAGAVYLSRDGAVGGTVIEIDDVAAATFGAGETPPLYAASVAESTLTVYSVDALGRSRLEARIELPPRAGESTPETTEVALAWDETRETLFVATGAGLFALGPRRTH